MWVEIIEVSIVCACLYYAYRGCVQDHNTRAHPLPLQNVSATNRVEPANEPDRPYSGDCKPEKAPPSYTEVCGTKCHQ